jgi:hypothetical protein
MTRQELHALRWQARLLGLLFTATLLSAGVVLWQRAWFEKFVREKYEHPEAPFSLSSISEAGGTQLDGYYEHWMTQTWASEDLPRALVEAAPAQMIARAERTLVCGSRDQKLRAALFLDLANGKDATGIIARHRHLAQRRHDVELAERLGRPLDRWRTP